MKVFQAISDALAAEGVDLAFALMGDANQNLFVDLAERHGVKIIGGRHEQNVVAMADGYARFSDGKLGVALVTGGPGFTNTATSLVAAKYHGSPVLLLAGAPSLGDLLNPQLVDQTACARLLAGAGDSLETPPSLDVLLRRALGHLKSGHGPFVLNLPSNVQNAEMPRDWSYRRGYTGYLRTVPDPDSLEQAARALQSAKHPGILVGRGAVRSGASKALIELATHLAAPIATTLPAKGMCSDYPLWLGVSGGLGEGVALPVLKERCDLLLVVGASLNQWTTHHGDLLKGRSLIRIDTDHQGSSAAGHADIPLQGDARSAAQALLEHLRSRQPEPRKPNEALKRQIAAGWQAHRAPIAYETGSDGTIDPRQVVRELDRLLPEERIVVAAGGHAGYLICQYVGAKSPANWNYTIDFGALGQGLGTALGAAFARPGKRIYHLTADGDFMMSLADFHTAVRYHLPITVVLLNDQAFGQERHDLLHKKLPEKYAAQPSPDFARLAEGFGARGFRFDTPESLSGLPAALERAHEFKGPTLFDMRINGEYESPVSQEIAKALA
jgi:acetolactate synthase-1/2/3 large subunit